MAQRARRDYLNALHQEILNTPWRGSQGRTVFFGGGTPSELSVPETAAVVDCLHQAFGFEPHSEWTIECNPGTVDLESLAGYRRMGFNRISLGVQSFDDHLLRTLGRLHNAAEAREAYQLARRAGFDNINIDLIFSLPDQTLDAWREDLLQALSLDAEHLSLYCLTIETGTVFGNRYAQGRLAPSDEDLSADMYEMAMDMTGTAGYPQYEISNYARPGYQCAHNLIYWKNDPYLGFGVSASSFFQGRRWVNTASMVEYSSSAWEGPVSLSSEENLEPRAALGEEIMLGLRTREGISLSGLSARYQFDVSVLFGNTLEFLQVHGLIRRGEDQVTLTRRGRLLANTVCTEFL